MNLKEASTRLGVHYQTAYKWVRSGQLSALRVGGRYEISEAAITRFVVNRHSVTAEPKAHERSARSDDLTSEDLLEALEAMALDPVVSVSSAVTFAAEQGAHVLGDLCLVVVMNRDRLHVDYFAIGHPEPDRAAFVSAVIGVLGNPPILGRSPASMPFFNGETVRVAHVPQDHLRAALIPELRQYLAQYSIHSLISAPIMSTGSPVGFIAFSRDTPTAPYTPDDEQYAARVGERIGALVQTAREIALAWRIRRELADDLHTHVDQAAGRQEPTGENMRRLLEAHPDAAALPVVMLDAACRFIAANERFETLSGYTSEAIAGKDIATVAHFTDTPSDDDSYDRLVSGELDYHDIHRSDILANGKRARYAAHRVAIRNPDASLYCILTVCRVLHTPTEPAVDTTRMDAHR